MKTHQTPRGKRPAFRLLAYALACAAILLAREVIVDYDGSASKKLGMSFNTMLMGFAKLGLGLSSLQTDKSHTGAIVPEGVTLSEKKRLLNTLPKGVTRNSADTSLTGKGSKVLDQASRKAIFVAAGVETFAK